MSFRATVPLAAVAVLAGALLVRAETPATPAPGGEVEEGFSLVEEGARLILRHMMDQMEPTLDEVQRDLGTALAEWGPALRDLSERVGDLSAYHAPEILENGDILIRRKTPVTPPPRPPLVTPNPDGTLDL